MVAPLIPLVPVAITAGTGAVASVSAGAGAAGGLMAGAAAAMPWVAAALLIISMVGSAQTAKIQARAARQEAEHRKRQNEAGVAVANAEGATSRTIQLINNARRLRAAEEQRKVMSINRARAQELYTRGGLETSIQQSEAAGAFAAKVAQKGLVSSTSDLIENTMQMRDARIKYSQQKNQGQVDYDTMLQIAGITAAGYSSLEMQFTPGKEDNTVILPPIQRGTDWAGIAGQAIMMYSNATNQNAQANYYDRQNKFVIPSSHPQARTG